MEREMIQRLYDELNNLDWSSPYRTEVEKYLFKDHTILIKEGEIIIIQVMTCLNLSNIRIIKCYGDINDYTVLNLLEDVSFDIGEVLINNTINIFKGLGYGKKND